MRTVKSYIKKKNGKELLYINDKPISPLAYITYFTDRNRYSDFAKKGYNLFSMPAMFSSQTINEVTQIPVFSKGFFDSDEPDFAEFDKNVYLILDACPHAYIFPRVNISLSKKWESEHPDELCDSGTKEHPQSKRACFASDLWAEEVKRLLSLLVSHIEGMDYCNNIVGYQISGGNTEEWFPFDKNGSKGKRSGEKFAEYVKENNLAGNDAEYFSFISDVVADRINEFASHVKQLTNNELVVGSFYGYTLECMNREDAHFALAKLLNCKNVDFICSPISYQLFRAVGFDNPYMVPLDSLKLHNKLYFSENDTRTHLTRPPFDIPEYQSKVWYGHSKEETIELMKMHFSRALINGHACWWFDMWGGWFADNDYMELMEKFLQITTDSLPLKIKNAAEVAFFVDEKMYTKLSISGTPKVTYCSNIRKPLGKMGLPYAKYLSSDFESVYNNYKAIISFVPLETEASCKIKEICTSNNIPLLEIGFRDDDVSITELKDFCKKADCRIYTDKEAVIYANNEFLFMHTCEQGTYKINLPENVKLFDMFSEELVSNELNCKLGESRLFKLLEK